MEVAVWDLCPCRAVVLLTIAAALVRLNVYDKQNKRGTLARLRR